MKIGEKIEIDIPNNPCFGCGPNNPNGLRLEFTRTAERSVETRFKAQPHHCGAPEVIHGGIQATLLDEVFGIVIRSQFASGEVPAIVTAEFTLRYRKPAPVGATVIVEGDFLREDGRNRFVEGRMRDEQGEVLTTAQARWVVLDSH